MDYKAYIEINPNIRFGKPVIKGTRISVFDILGWLASGMSYEEITAEYPSIKKKHSPSFSIKGPFPCQAENAVYVSTHSLTQVPFLKGEYHATHNLASLHPCCSLDGLPGGHLCAR